MAPIFTTKPSQGASTSGIKVRHRRKFSGEADGSTPATVDFVATAGMFPVRANGEVLARDGWRIKKPFTIEAQGYSYGAVTNIDKVRNYATQPKVQGINAYAVFFPPFKFIWQDEEPGSFYTSADEIQGLVTGVPQLGSMLMPAFVNEPMDVRWYGARSGINDWGDGTHQNPGGFVHTYTATGFYWIGAQSATNEFLDEEGAPTTIPNYKAARLVHVIERDPRGGGGDLDESGNIWTHTKPYKIAITEATEGSIDGAFAMQFSLVGKGNYSAYPYDSKVGHMPSGTGLAVFIESFEDGVKLPQLQIVAGGFVAQRTAADDPYTEVIAAIAYDPLYWMNMQQMREQYYVNQGLITSQALGEMAYDIINDHIDECGKRTTTHTPVPGEPSYTINIPALNLALLGYIPEHILATLRPDMAAAHMIQHVRITVPDLEIPYMYNLPRPTHFANLGQLANIVVAPTFSEKVALGGYHSFSVSAGSVLSNIRSMLENQGALFHSRSDMTFVMDYKPFHKETLPPAQLDLLLPPTINPGLVAEGVPQPLWRVQIQKPLLGFTFGVVELPNDGTTPLNPATGQPANSSDLGLIIKSKAYLNGLLGVSAEVWSDWYKAVAMPLYQAMDSPMTVDINNWDYYNDSLDQRNFLWEVEVGDPGGRIIGPVQNVFTDNLQTFAVGIAKEAMAHWQMVIPLAGAPHIDLGDIVYVTKESKGLNINWTRKPFWVIGLRILMRGDVQVREITVLEINPEEVVVHTPPEDPD